MRQSQQSSPTARDRFLYAAGLGFLALAKAKHVLKGNSSPKTFDISETDRAVAYDLKVVDQWFSYLREYAGNDNLWRGKNILELGPGSDLGVGLYLLAKGAATYHACDVNNLTQSAPQPFYDALLRRVGTIEPGADIESLRRELRAARAAEPSRLKLVVRRDFDLSAAFAPRSIDLVFSQAAFEHFDDVEATVAALSAVCKSGALIVAVIDLKTHSRWIRDADPNNIYRYSDRLYRGFWFRGAPNRVRPYQYREIFETYGWSNIAIRPLGTIAERHRRQPGVHDMFKDARNQLDYLSIVFCAEKN